MVRSGKGGPEVTYALHLGTYQPEQLLAAIHQMPEQTFRDGDSWEEWGEKISNPEYAHHPEHIIVEHAYIANLMRTFSRVLEDVPHLLVPMTFPFQAGLIASVTPMDDWSEEELRVIDRPAWSWIERQDLTGEAQYTLPGSRRWTRFLNVRYSEEV